MTPRQRNEIYEKVGRVDKSWRPTPPPERVLKYWRWHLDIHHRRQWVSGSPMRLTWSEFQAWMIIRKVHLKQAEIDIMFALDDAFFIARANPEGLSTEEQVQKEQKGLVKQIATGLRAMMKSTKDGKGGIKDLTNFVRKKFVKEST